MYKLLYFFKGYYAFGVMIQIRFLPFHFECESDTPNMYTQHHIPYGIFWCQVLKRESPVRVCVSVSACPTAYGACPVKSSLYSL